MRRPGGFGDPPHRAHSGSAYARPQDPDHSARLTGPQNAPVALRSLCRFPPADFWASVSRIAITRWELATIPTILMELTRQFFHLCFQIGSAQGQGQDEVCDLMRCLNAGGNPHLVRQFPRTHPPASHEYKRGQAAVGAAHFRQGTQAQDLVLTANADCEGPPVKKERLWEI